MFNKKNYKKVIILVLALVMILGTVALAAEGVYQKNLTATYGKIKFNYEGSDVTSQIESTYGAPAFIAGGISYAPVRAIADLVGVDIKWDEKTNTAYITDPKVEEHRKQLDDKDDAIAELKAKIEKLENKVKEEEKKEEVSKGDLKSLEASLNKKYSEYEKVEFDISLKESGNTITMEITTNLGHTRDEQNWIRMNYSDKKYLIENAVTEVEREFKNAAITGNVYDSFSRRNLYTFRLNANGSVTISNNDYGGYYDDRYYDDRYYDDRYYDDRYYDGYVDTRVRSEFKSEGISDAKLVKIDYSGRTAYLEIDIPADAESKWNSLSTSVKRSMLEYISSGIDSGYYYGNIDYVEVRIYAGPKLIGTY